MSVELDAASPSVQVQLSADEDDVCNGDQSYQLSYTYDGSSSYTVLDSMGGTVSLQVTGE